MNDIVPSLAAVPTPDAGTTSPPADAAQRPAKRGRKPESPAQRLERLEQAVKDAKIAAREAEQRKCAVVGAAVLAAAEVDNALKKRLREILLRHVTTASAKADIASLLIG